MFYSIAIFLYCPIYLPSTRKRIVSLYIGRDVHSCFGVAIFEVSTPPVFPIKMGGSHEMPCLSTQQTNLPKIPLNAECLAGSCGYHFLKFFGMDSIRGMNPRSTNYGADALGLATTPSRRMNIIYNI